MKIEHKLDCTLLQDHVTTFKALVVLVSSDLNWKDHINNVVRTCNRVNCMIKRVVDYHAPNNVVVWEPSFKKLLVF